MGGWVFKFVYYQKLRTRRSLFNLLGLVKYVTELVTVCCKNYKSYYVCIITLKRLLVKYENMGLCIHIFDDFVLNSK